jgi:hypothetical protein
MNLFRAQRLYFTVGGDSFLIQGLQQLAYQRELLGQAQQAEFFFAVLDLNAKTPFNLVQVIVKWAT